RRIRRDDCIGTIRPRRYVLQLSEDAHVLESSCIWPPITECSGRLWIAGCVHYGGRGGAERRRDGRSYLGDVSVVPIRKVPEDAVSRAIRQNQRSGILAQSRNLPVIKHKEKRLVLFDGSAITQRVLMLVRPTAAWKRNGAVVLPTASVESRVSHVP